MYKKIFALLLSFILINSMSACSVTTPSENPNELSYYTARYEADEDTYTVMIMENEKYVPYLVISDDYNGTGNCLLLRKYILDERLYFNKLDENTSYYKDSYIDEYLNTQFLSSINSVSDLIVDTDVSIVPKERLGFDSAEKHTETITRKVFILSQREIFDFGPQEGKFLIYFEDTSKLIARNSNNKRMPWTTRTCGIGEEDLVVYIDSDGNIGSDGLSGILGSGPNLLNLFHFRPAFCMAGNTPVTVKDGLVYIDTAQ